MHHLIFLLFTRITHTTTATTATTATIPMIRPRPPAAGFGNGSAGMSNSSFIIFFTSSGYRILIKISPMPNDTALAVSDVINGLFASVRAR